MEQKEWEKEDEIKARTLTQNKKGEYVPAIPLPYYGLRKECQCGKKFWTENGYEGHYALEHIMQLI